MKKVRPFGWVIIAINAYFIANFFKDYDSNADATANGIGVIVLFSFLAIVNSVLYVLFRVTAKKQRECPACGKQIKTGITVCPFCNFDFFKSAGGLRE